MSALLPCGEAVIQRLLETLVRHLYHGEENCSCGYVYAPQVPGRSGYRLHFSNLLHGRIEETKIDADKKAADKPMIRSRPCGRPKGK